MQLFDWLIQIFHYHLFEASFMVSMLLYGLSDQSFGLHEITSGVNRICCRKFFFDNDNFDNVASFK